ncbi:NarL family two-component system response regulator YdfI [Virgibacillus natechei]|uniref:NarL family two-component system response regulator YdfI n=1 Tax=Virgibacillus natechei TaxID=1216297 RepID=A0ABS4IEA8_9BACI|nr:response regulator transcription factor [Virgibacillus natechei]MBP1969268.1 NarL family two-component system response regulator YdfI [Virgibacillus natechei]UZD12425.1 response regulator transcription factor [Virgibacillus natechei]
MNIKILIVDDHLVVREGLKLILETNEAFEVIDEAQNGKEAMEFIDKQKPDVILLDLKMPVVSGLETMQQLRQRDINIPIIILTTYNEDELMIKGMKLGAKGYLLKDTNRDHLFRTIEAAYRGETLIQPEIMEKLFQESDKEKKSNNRADTYYTLLTEKEISILQAVCDGHRNKEVAIKFGIAERTVKFHLTNIYNKLGVDSRAEAVSHSIKRGYITP